MALPRQSCIRAVICPNTYIYILESKRGVHPTQQQPTMDFDQPLRLRHTKHYAVFHDHQTVTYAKSDLQGVYQTARQAFIALKRIRMECYDGYIYPIDANPDFYLDNGIGLLRVLDGSYVGWGYQFCVPGEELVITLRVKATFVYHEDLDPDHEDEGAGASSLHDDFSVWQYHCEIPYDEVQDEQLEHVEFPRVNGTHAEDHDSESGDGLAGRSIIQVD